jgi:hypothetical protein
MLSRRTLVVALASGATTLAIGRVSAAQPVVEILAMGHAPVQDALKTTRSFLGGLTTRVRVVELDIESSEGVKRVKAVGLKGHIPIVLLINGDYRYRRADGTAVEFVNFPAKANNPLGFNGRWTTADFEAAIGAALGEQPKQP